MFGSKLRSWMEAVRPRKKQHRKDKQANKSSHIEKTVSILKNSTETKCLLSNYTPTQEEIQTSRTTFSGPTCSRYSAANLSSPESAYSTGYSTDGTSPGAPPEYYVKAKPDTKTTVTVELECDKSLQVNQQQPTIQPEISSSFLNTTMVELASPRQRNRIRTNPWLPSTKVINPQQNLRTTELIESSNMSSNSHCLTESPNTRKSVSSSSCSSLSGAGSYWEASEDDCTLNEMMGKYDESYVYEKETDILSDSEPTDFDTDIDTGQDGGDEDEAQEGELDYIDDGSFTESGIGEIGKNTGHCSYFNFHAQRKISRKRTGRKPRHRTNSSKKRQHPVEITPQITIVDGSRSVGATPLFARRSRQLPISKLALEENLKKRSNSVHIYRDHNASIDRKDKEAERKYEELIVEAEHILRNIKTEGLSPRRLPGPANKRVELLRSAECPKTRMGDIPSNNFSPRFASKVNHVASRSPIPIRQQPERTVHRSPKHKRKASKARLEIHSSSSEDEPPRLSRITPQSEPVRRKVYASTAKTMAFQPTNSIQPHGYRNSAESLRHQVLLNTIANLKRSLEDQSASLKQGYRSSQHIPLCL